MEVLEDLTTPILHLMEKVEHNPQEELQEQDSQLQRLVHNIKEELVLSTQQVEEEVGMVAEVQFLQI